MKTQVAGLAGLLVIAMASTVYSQAETRLTYRGQLSDRSGNAVPDGEHDFLFSIHEAAAGGAALWEEAQNAVPVRQGRYSVTLGRQSAIGLPDGRYWLETTIDGETLSPRSEVELTASTRADCTVDGNLFVTGDASIGGGVDGENHKLVLRGPNAPAGSSSYQDISYELAAAGSAKIRSFRGDSWDTYLQFLTTPYGAGGDLPQVRMTLDGQGNVGIGTTSPGAKLEVKANTSNTPAFRGQNLGTGLGVYGASGAGVEFLYLDTGVQGVSFASNGNGVLGIANSGSNAYGVYGGSTSGYAGWFAGKVHVNGALTKSSGAFKIDHPLDPANKVLYHSFVESPDMKNIYDGVVVLDGRGEATVKLPPWFDALNRDFRYQLTAIGQPAPELYIAREISGNEFEIAGGDPGLKVSWQVTGIRQDAYANAHRLPVEEEKTQSEQGYYLHPELFGQPEEKGLEWVRNPELMRQLKQDREKAGSAERP
jgi:hypothetical protein